MNFVFFKKLSFLFIAPAILLFLSESKNVSFSGEWSLNEGKSDMGQFANIVPKKIKVEQKDDAISITRNSTGFNGEDVSQSETLTFDGKESESTVFGTSKRKAMTKWSDDGQTLTITFNLALDFNGELTEVTGSEVWTLADGGKTFIVNSNSTSSFGDNSFKGVYEK